MQDWSSGDNFSSVFVLLLVGTALGQGQTSNHTRTTSTHMTTSTPRQLSSTHRTIITTTRTAMSPTRYTGTVHLTIATQNSASTQRSTPASQDPTTPTVSTVSTASDETKVSTGNKMMSTEQPHLGIVVGIPVASVALVVGIIVMILIAILNRKRKASRGDGELSTTHAPMPDLVDVRADSPTSHNTESTEPRHLDLTNIATVYAENGPKHGNTRPWSRVRSEDIEAGGDEAVYQDDITKFQPETESKNDAHSTVKKPANDSQPCHNSVSEAELTESRHLGVPNTSTVYAEIGTKHSNTRPWSRGSSDDIETGGDEAKFELETESKNGVYSVVHKPKKKLQSELNNDVYSTIQKPKKDIEFDLDITENPNYEKISDG